MTSSPGIPYTYDRTHSTAAIRATYEGLEPATETGDVVRIAGRLMLRRVQGKLAFGSLADSSGRIQLFANASLTPEFDDFCSLQLGDWIGVNGVVMTTRKGELSVRVDGWVVLARAERSFPDKWHGLSDPDTRYRQRYVDLWVTDESRATFQARSKIMSLTRRWLEDERGYMEVETPIFHPIPGGAIARPFITHHNALDNDMYLRIAPELYLKRLIAGGFERVFEIARVFRNEGLSTRHNPEFTMLELYQAYADYHDIMKLTEDLVEYLALQICGTTQLTYNDRPLNLSAPWRRATMTDLIKEFAGVDVNIDTSLEEMRAHCDDFGVPYKPSHGVGKLIMELYEKTGEQNLWDPVFVIDYPVEVSPLSREHRGDPRLTERFEGIIAGRELCNAFSELVDPVEQRKRFEAQAAESAAGDDEAMVVDEDYLRCQEYGMPPTGGLGIGMDRLVMLLTNCTTIRDVVLFPTLRPEQM